MLVKWVRCVVEPDSREAFSTAQAGWHAAGGVPGLLAQVGGWDIGDPQGACIVALWRDQPAYDSFMLQRHDQLVDSLGQLGTYSAIETATGDVVLKMGGAAPSVPAAMTAGHVLRVADCHVHPERIDHFVEAQRNVWAPGMAAADGMLGGLFSRLARDHFLVTTFWRDLEAHQAYLTDHFAQLRTAAEADRDLAAISGYVISMLDTWRVVTTQDQWQNVAGCSGQDLAAWGRGADEGRPLAMGSPAVQDQR